MNDNYKKIRILKNAKNSLLPVSQNMAYQFSAGYALSIYKINGIYTFIPKNACSTLRFSVAVANGFLSDIKDVNWIHYNNGTFKSSQQEIANAKYTFVVLRCPFKRLVSCFFEKFVDGRFKLNGKDGSPLDTNFTEFIDFIKASKNEEMDEHWRPQVDFLHYEEYDNYFCLEEFPKAIKSLNKRGLEVIDTRKSLGHDKSRLLSQEGEFSSTNISELKKMKENGYAPLTRCFYTPKTYEIIEQKYREDIKLYKQYFGEKNLLKI